jgi:hypothetical protein
MGNIKMISSDFHVPESPDVLDAIHGIETRFGALRGNGFLRQIADLRAFGTVREVFNRLDFITSYDPRQGTISLDSYDALRWHHSFVLAVLAPFIVDDSFIAWADDDNRPWRETVRGGELFHALSQTVRIETPYRHHHLELCEGVGAVWAVIDPRSDDSVSVQAKISAGIEAKINEAKINDTLNSSQKTA